MHLNIQILFLTFKGISKADPYEKVLSLLCLYWAVLRMDLAIQHRQAN